MSTAMNTAAVVLLGVTAAFGLALTMRGERWRPAWAAALLCVLLATAAALAWAGGDAPEGLAEGAAVAGVLAAVTGGGPFATAILATADPRAAGVGGGPQDPEILRGGAWIGVLERAAIAASLLAGSAEGLVVLAAVKGLGRYAELRAPAAAERFIIGTLASALWAAASVGVALLLRG